LHDGLQIEHLLHIARNELAHFVNHKHQRKTRLTALHQHANAPHPLTLPIAAIALFGTTMGGIAPALPYLTSRYFGVANFDRLFGIIAGLSGLGFAVGPLLAGYAFDVSKSYAPFLAGTIPALLIAALLIISLGRYPDGDRPAA